MKGALTCHVFRRAIGLHRDRRALTNFVSVLIKLACSQQRQRWEISSKSPQTSLVYFLFIKSNIDSKPVKLKLKKFDAKSATSKKYSGSSNGPHPTLPFSPTASSLSIQAFPAIQVFVSSIPAASSRVYANTAYAVQTSQWFHVSHLFAQQGCATSSTKSGTPSDHLGTLMPKLAWSSEFPIPLYDVSKSFKFKRFQFIKPN